MRSPFKPGDVLREINEPYRKLTISRYVNDKTIVNPSYFYVEIDDDPGHEWDMFVSELYWKLDEGFVLDKKLECLNEISNRNQRET